MDIFIISNLALYVVVILPNIINYTKIKVLWIIKVLFSSLISHLHKSQKGIIITGKLVEILNST